MSAWAGQYTVTDQDLDRLRRAVDALAEHLPRGDVVDLEGAHASHIQSIDRFIEALEEHLHKTS